MGSVIPAGRSDGCVTPAPGHRPDADLADDVLLARAYLSRVAEPTCIPLWRDVSRFGPVAVAEAIRSGDVAADLRRATVSRAGSTNAHDDLDAAARHGMRLITPEMRAWPHAALACLESTGAARLRTYAAGMTTPAHSGELVPPVALWVRGDLDLSALTFRSVALVGARACTQYGELVTKQLAYGLAMREFEIVSGGAFGIDAAAHRACLSAGGRTIIVSAGGADGCYPPAHQKLFDRVAEEGAIVSESPPGSAPQRRRFLTRNRLVAALATGTVVVEAAHRSGAINTAAHCRDMGRILMAVPGPVTSTLSAGCHKLLREPHFGARLVTDVEDVVSQIGGSSDLSGSYPGSGDGAEGRDQLDADSRQILEGLPSRGRIGLDRLAATSGVPATSIIQRVAALEADGYLLRHDDGFRLGPRRPT